MIDWTNLDVIGVLIGLGMIAFGLIGLLVLHWRGKHRS
jgi:hypothetical protein